MNYEEHLKSIGVEIPPAPAPVGNYLPYVISGNLIHLSGSICMKEGQMVYTGAVGKAQNIENAYEAAKLCAINQLSILKSAIGNLNRVTQLVSLTGFVYGVEGFSQSPQVVNGASDFFVNVFGEKGKHSRAAVSVSGLPANSTVEIQCVFEITE